MEIKRSDLKNNIRKACEEARDNPVFISHYNEITTVLISKKQYDEWKNIADEIKEDSENT